MLFCMSSTSRVLLIPTPKKREYGVMVEGRNQEDGQPSGIQRKKSKPWKEWVIYLEGCLFIQNYSLEKQRRLRVQAASELGTRGLWSSVDFAASLYCSSQACAASVLTESPRLFVVRHFFPIFSTSKRNDSILSRRFSLRDCCIFLARDWAACISRLE